MLTGKQGDPYLTKLPPNPDRRAARGEEEWVFACEISSILGRMPLKNDLKLKLLQDLRLDELDRLEIVMEAEAIWAARLLPERFLQGDIEQVLEPFSTLEDIISAAHNLADSYREKPKR